MTITKILSTSATLACAAVLAGAGFAPPPPPPDAQMQAVLDEHAKLGPRPLETLTAHEARRQPSPADAVKQLLRRMGKPTTPDPAVKSMDRMIQGAAGMLPARVYTPVAASGPLPVVVYFHGGGWVIADKDVYDGGARAISRHANAVVVSVDYRQGPEHRFPAAHDDAIAAYRWALANAPGIGGRANDVSLAGESAGGNLAIATAMAARDQGLQLPRSVLAVYPIAGGDTTTASYREHAHAKPLSRAGMNWFFDNYLRTPQDRWDPRINLVGANLRGLPPVTIINAEVDPLLSEGELLAAKLRDAGNMNYSRTFKGTAHEFFGMAAVVDAAKAANDMAGMALRMRISHTN